MAKAQLVDVHVGNRMRQRRTLLGMSQSKVAEAVGLTFQQIQKYERGSNRIGLAWAFMRYSSDYVGAERQAKAAKLGVHAHGCEPAWEWRAQQRTRSEADTPR